MEQAYTDEKEIIFLEVCYNLAKAKNKKELISAIENIPLARLKTEKLTVTLLSPGGREEVYSFSRSKSPSTPIPRGEEWSFEIEMDGVTAGHLRILPEKGKKEDGIERKCWNTLAKTLGVSLAKILREKELMDELQAREEEVEMVTEALRKTREAQATFMKRMAHELRTPLHSIIGFSQILEGEKEGMPINTQKCLDLIIEKAKEMKESLEDIFLLWDTKTPSWEIHPRKVHIPSLIEEVLESFTSSILEKGLQIEKEIQISKAIMDRDRMARALHHLLSNAVKFTPPKGKIKVRVLGTPGGIGIWVCDTGIGISPQHMEEIWEPFKQLEDLLTRKYKGMGIGLSLVKRIVETHGGQVWAEGGIDGQGTCFVMLIPQPPKENGGNNERDG